MYVWAKVMYVWAWVDLKGKCRALLGSDIYLCDIEDVEGYMHYNIS